MKKYNKYLLGDIECAMHSMIKGRVDFPLTAFRFLITSVANMDSCVVDQFAITRLTCSFMLRGMNPFRNFFNNYCVHSMVGVGSTFFISHPVEEERQSERKTEAYG